MNFEGSLAWLIIGALVIWLIVLIVVIVNIIRRTDLSLALKLLWIICILSFPLIGLIIYLVMGKKSL